MILLEAFLVLLVVVAILFAVKAGICAVIEFRKNNKKESK